MRFRFCPACGAPLGSRHVDGRERPACDACGQVIFLDPKVAVAVLVERAGQILLVQRGHDPGRGDWCPPCGFVDTGEHPELAAAREVREEAGLDVSVGPLQAIYVVEDDPRGPGLLLVYAGALLDAAAPAPGADTLAAAFFSPDALPPLSYHLHEQALRDYFMRGGTSS
jgi:8-oxo-dGTP diphosphatase